MSLKQAICNTTLGMAMAAGFATATTAEIMQGDQDPEFVYRETVTAALGEIPVVGSALGLLATLIWTEPDELEELRRELIGYVDGRFAALARQEMLTNVSDLEHDLARAARYRTGFGTITGEPLPEEAAKTYFDIQGEVDTLLNRDTYLPDLPNQSTDEFVMAIGALAVVRMEAMEFYGQLNPAFDWPQSADCAGRMSEIRQNPRAVSACTWEGEIQRARTRYERALDAAITLSLDRRAGRITFTDWHTSGDVLNIGLERSCAQRIINAMRGAESLHAREVYEDRNTWTPYGYSTTSVHVGTDLSAFGILDYYTCTYHEIPQNDQLITANYPCGDTICPVSREYYGRHAYIMRMRADHAAMWQRTIMDRLTPRGTAN